MRHIIIALHSIRLALFFLFFRKSFDFHDRFSTKVQETFEVLGGGFIKIGQMMSMRVEFLPEVYCQKLRNCYDAAPAISHKDVQKCLKGIEQHFSSIEWEPIASASVAQVHKAELLTGEIVAVKILRPGIRKVIRKDLFWWNLLAFFVKKRFSRIPKKKWKEMVTYVCEHVVQETDLINEAKNMALMQRKVLTDRIMIPQVHSLLSSSSVLIMEFLAGKTLNQVIREANYDQTWLTQFTVDTFIEHIRMASLTGFFHADLHPANIVILENDKIGLLDFGSVGYFAEDQRGPFILYMLGSVMYDVDIAVRGAVILGQPPEGFDREEFRARSAQVMDWFRDVTAKEMTPTQYLLHGIQIMLDYGGLFPPVVPLYARSSANLDGIIRSLNPDYILAYPMRAVMFQTYKDHKLANARLVPRVILLLEELLDVVEDSPEKIREIIDRVFSQEV